MSKNNKGIFYWVIIILLVCILSVCTYFSIMYIIDNPLGDDGFNTKESMIVFGSALFVVGIICTVFQIKKLFKWLYKKLVPLAESAKFEWVNNLDGFSVNTPVAYRALKISTIVVYCISIIFYFVALLICP